MHHAIITALLQTATGLATGNWLYGGLFAIGLYIGREHAQAEYRWIEKYGAGRRANMPWWGGYDPRVWGWKSLTDWLLPVAVVFTLATLAGMA